MENLLDVARYIASKNPLFTDKQIQKITYYAYCWYIVKNNIDANNIINRLVQEHPEAWIHGPVFYALYEEMMYNRKGFFDRQVNLKADIKSFLDIIVNIYGKYTGNQLEDLTHNELPWIEARHGLPPDVRSREKLKDNVIYNFYKY